MGTHSDEVRHVLLEAGWAEDRSVNTHSYALANAAAGASWPAAAAAFLSEFGGLHLRFFRHDGSVGTMHFDVPQALLHPKARQVFTLISQQLQSPALAIVGQAYGEDLVLLMDAQGRVYGGGCDDCLYLVGATAAEAIAAVCLDLPFRQL